MLSDVSARRCCSWRHEHLHKLFWTGHRLYVSSFVIHDHAEVPPSTTALSGRSIRFYSGNTTTRITTTTSSISRLDSDLRSTSCSLKRQRDGPIAPFKKENVTAAGYGPPSARVISKTCCAHALCVCDLLASVNAQHQTVDCELPLHHFLH